MKRLRAAIYARHSTDKQNPASSDDQVEACRPLLERVGADLVETYVDPVISGYRRDRPGLKRLLDDIANGRVDIVVCEAVDRIARDGEDINWLSKKLSYHRVRLFTSSEGEIDEMKLAIAGMLGSMFLTALRTKTFRGLRARVLAGRLAGGRAYGYRKVGRVDADGNVVNGIVEIEEEAAAVVRRIFRDFAAGLSSRRIAEHLNAEGVASPRGGEWSPSTIRGDPKKLVGILNNPLYEGRIIWGRREWRKNPDSDRRERGYRLRDEAEWIKVAVPDLRIVDPELIGRVRAEMKSRERPGAVPTNRARHLLSGLLRCGSCGANHVLVGKDYYRCGRNKDRGTCADRTSVRVARAEEAVLAALQSHLLTPDLVKLFQEEFTREVARLTRSREEAEGATKSRLAELDTEIANLAQHFLAGAVSPTLSRMLAEREAEKSRLEARLAPPSTDGAAVLPHPVLLRRYEAKVLGLREALNDALIRSEATEVIRRLVVRIVVHSDAEGAAVLEVVASTATLIDFAQTSNAPRPKAAGRSIEVVAGMGFEPVPSSRPAAGGQRSIRSASRRIMRWPRIAGRSHDPRHRISAIDGIRSARQISVGRPRGRRAAGQNAGTGKLGR